MNEKTKTASCRDCGVPVMVSLYASVATCGDCRRKRRRASFRKHDEKRRPSTAGLPLTCADCGVDFPYSGKGSRPRRCRTCAEQRRREYEEKHRPQRIDNPVSRRTIRLKHRFQISPDEYERLLTEQGGVCVGCLSDPAHVGSLVVDHDWSCCPGERSCGKCIRGLLCRKCNSALGMVRDDTKVLRQMIRYLGKKVDRS